MAEVFFKDLGEIAGLEGFPRAMESKGTILTYDGLPSPEGDDTCRYISVRDNGAGDKEHCLVSVIGLPETWTQIFDGESVDSCVWEESCPFLAYGGYAHTEVAYGAGEGEGEKIEVIFHVVEENDFHINA